MHMPTYTHTYTHIYIHTYIYVYTYIRTYIYICTYTSTCVQKVPRLPKDGTQGPKPVAVGIYHIVRFVI